VVCPQICATCTTSVLCQSCNIVNGLPYFHKSNTCLPNCPVGDYAHLPSLSCITCASECLSCFGATNTKCYTCASGYNLIYGTEICNQSCPDGQYANTTSRQCLLCASQCITCINSSSTCLTCGYSTLGSNFFLYGTQCLLRCPVGYWANVASFTCDVCNSACLSCTNGSTSSCSACGNISSTIYYK
jgi:proprotein convertase subtilisin/kexin type 5